MKNFFGEEIIPMINILNDNDCISYISLTLNRYLSSIGVKNESINSIISDIISIAKNTPDQSLYERIIHNLLVENSSNQNLANSLKERANRIGGQLLPHLKPGNVFDDGCGDGFVAEFIAGKGYEVFVADVYKHIFLNTDSLKFLQFQENDPLPYTDNSFDNTILCTVLHHSIDPLFTLHEAIRVTNNGGRILVIESVYDINTKEVENAAGEDYLKAFLNLSAQKQYWVNMFFDHFYNRCFHYSDDPKKKVYVPFNYRTPEGWKRIFESNNLAEEYKVNLGIDQPLAPLFHTLLILKKI